MTANKNMLNSVYDKGKNMLLSNSSVLELIKTALKEDIGAGDFTTNALFPEPLYTKAAIIANQALVVSGCEVAQAVCHEVNRQIKLTFSASDRDRAKAGQTIITLDGSAQAILTAERTALNFLQRMSGIATLTAKFVEKAKRYNITILDTRKTTPTFRLLEKYAVICGGGTNHRMGLYDRILIKDNHRKLWLRKGQPDLSSAVIAARKAYPDISVEIEVESESELDDVLKVSPDWILLDNMPIVQVKRCVKMCAGKCRLELSGGITFDNIEAVAATGVDAISLGCLTNAAPSVDISLELGDE